MGRLHQPAIRTCDALIEVAWSHKLRDMCDVSKKKHRYDPNPDKIDRVTCHLCGARAVQVAGGW